MGRFDDQPVMVSMEPRYDAEYWSGYTDAIDGRARNQSGTAQYNCGYYAPINKSSRSKYHSSNGREISLVELKIVLTYRNALQGTPLAISDHIRKDLEKIAARVLPLASPLAMIPCPPGELPDWLCVAKFTSPHGVRHTDPDYSSRLYACWFTNDISIGIDAMVASVVAKLDWDVLAEEYNMLP